MSVLQNTLQYIWTKLNSDTPCPLPTLTQLVKREQLTLMQWQWQWHSIGNTQDCLFLHRHQQMFCLDYVHIVRIGFRLEMCNCWVLTRVCFYSRIIPPILEYSNNNWLLWTHFCRHMTSGRPFVLRKHLIVTSTSTKRLLETTWEVARCWSCLTIHRISI